MTGNLLKNSIPPHEYNNNWIYYTYYYMTFMCIYITIIHKYRTYRYRICLFRWSAINCGSSSIFARTLCFLLVYDFWKIERICCEYFWHLRNLHKDICYWSWLQVGEKWSIGANWIAVDISLEFVRLKALIVRLKLKPNK